MPLPSPRKDGTREAVPPDERDLAPCEQDVGQDADVPAVIGLAGLVSLSRLCFALRREQVRGSAPSLRRAANAGGRMETLRQEPTEAGAVAEMPVVATAVNLPCASGDSTISWDGCETDRGCANGPGPLSVRPP